MLQLANNLLACFCIAAFEEPRRRKRRSKKHAEDAETSPGEVDESAEQDTAAATASTAWATKEKTYDADLSADRTVVSPFL